MPLNQLTSDISFTLINTAADAMDREISIALKQVRDALQLDGLCLLAVPSDNNEAILANSTLSNGIETVTEKNAVRWSFPWANNKLLCGEAVMFNSIDELPPEAAVDRLGWEMMGVTAALALPIRVAGSVAYFLVAHARGPRRIPPELFPQLRLIGEILASALVRCKQADRQGAPMEVEHKAALADLENVLAQPLRFQDHDNIVGRSAGLASTLTMTEQVAPTDTTVLITGETGTGKELIAREIHRLSLRRKKPMVTVNCASLPAALVESELFGREKGAYTGALTQQAGRFEMADGGTIFLDEIAEMSLELQAKLLRVLQEGQFERLGSTKTIHVDVRVVAATNRNLDEEVKKGKFREDLFYRLNVFHIAVPALRERSEDIPLLVWTFVNELGDKMGKRINKISNQDMAALQSYHWPGNIRQLRNVIERAVIVSNSESLDIQVPENEREEISGTRTLEEYEIMHIRQALHVTGGRIKGDGGAARLLGLNPSTLYSRMQKLGITPRQIKKPAYGTNKLEDEISP